MAGCMKMTNGFPSLSAKLLVFMVVLLCLPQTSGYQDTGNKHPVTDLQDGEQYVMSGSNRFCYENLVVPSWRQAWTRIQVKVWSSNVFKVETVVGEEELQELDRFSVWGWFQSLLRERHNETTININLFSKKTCFKIDPADKTKYTVKPLRKFDIYLFLVFLAGASLFTFAGSLSRSQVFFYSAGMSTGMIASLIIIFFILARFLPKKSPFYVLIVGGWSFSLYAIQLVFRNLGVILREHWNVALGYVTVVGFITFAVCYRYGPLVDAKSINILSWTLQLFGLLLIYFGIQIQQVAFAIIVAALFSKHLEYPVFLTVAAWRKVKGYVRWKPEPRRLLTDEEYQKQGEEETLRALEMLRKQCNSPEFSPWKTVSRLQSPKRKNYRLFPLFFDFCVAIALAVREEMDGRDPPSIRVSRAVHPGTCRNCQHRFADFIEGSPHLMSNEVSVHVQEYGFGGSFFEDELFDTDDEDDNIKPMMIPE